MSGTLTAIVQDEQDTQREKYLTFSLGSETFGIGIQYVTEIVGLQKITIIPETPAYVKGVINLRGSIIPVVDMRLRFKKEPMDYTDRTCIVVIAVQAVTAGLIVDDVDEVVTIPEALIVPPPDCGSGCQSRYISGIGKAGDDIRLLLDCDRLFAGEEFQTLSRIAE